MKKITLFTFCCLFLNLHSFSQDRVRVKVLSICSYSDGTLFKGQNVVTGDTINIISTTNGKVDSRRYKRIEIGEEYFFVIKKMTTSQAYFNDNFSIRIKTTVVWRPKDGIKNVPVVAKNTNGIYIPRNDLH